MASNDAHLGVLPSEDSSAPANKWLPQAVQPEFVERYNDVVATMTNTSGVALTHVLRFLILTPAALCLVFVEFCVRLDSIVKNNYRKLGVDRG